MRTDLKIKRLLWVYVVGLSGSLVAEAGTKDVDLDFFGRTGDVILVDLGAATGGASFTGLDFGGISGASIASTNAFDGQPFSDTGRFYIIPDTINGTGGDTNANSIGFQGVLSGSVKIDGVDQTFEITVREGYSGAGRGAVTAGDSDPVSIARQQQRLNYFGYPAQGGSTLSVDGDYGPMSESAVKLFQAATQSNGAGKPGTGSSDGVVGPNTTAWLNAANAPSWVELIDPDPQGIPFSIGNGQGNFDILPGIDSGGGRSGATPQPERWATSWTVETIEQASAVASGTQTINGLSTDDGYGSSAFHQTHQAGMDIDLNVPGSVMNFGNGVLSSAESSVVDVMVAFVTEAAEGSEAYRMIISNTDIRDEFNTRMNAIGSSSFAIGDSSGVHLNHVHIDMRLTSGAIAMTGDAAGDFNIDGSVDGDDIDLLFKNVGGDASIYNLAATSTLVTDKDVDFLIEDILGTVYGDGDLDQDVDFADFVLLRDNWTGSLVERTGDKGWALGDWDGDWDVDEDDLAVFTLNQNVAFNGAEQAAFDAFIATIPEPTAGMLMLLGAMGVTVRRRRG
ncbi:peptidoglycan-binding protein [Poriferisphaera sp. WC338]|uniref:peptidoglycan-binding protein n=1 Tax=Poriferisphaera sp. WC338 TaxID=3425129 RepID=UPI003D8126DB